MRIAILGTGQVAAVMAPKLKVAGHHVVIGSRDPQQQPAWMSAAGSEVALASHEGAVAVAAVVVNALPGAAAVQAMSLLGDELNGKVVMDVANAIVPSDDGIALSYPNGSLAEELRGALPRARVVKAMNTVSALVMEDPGALPAPSSIFVSGDDPDAKQVVKSLLRDLGWPAESIIDLGRLETARGPEHLFQLLVPLFAWGTPMLNLAVIR
jgi:8-hydroxy-5-deazaflavin:NADPH oxidoreductase